MRPGPAWRNLRLRSPLLAGLAEGTAAMLAVMFLHGLFPEVLRETAWAPLVWVALSWRRPTAFQTGVALSLGLLVDFLAGEPAGRSLLPLVAVLLVTSRVGITGGKRWSPAHALAGGVALFTWWIVFALLALLSSQALAPGPSAWLLVKSAGLLCLSCSVAAVVLSVRQARSRAAGRLPSRRVPA